MTLSEKIGFWAIVLYFLLAPISYSGCMGYWTSKYPGSDVWDHRGFCAIMAIVPILDVEVFFSTGFFHKGFSL